jgi:hypothetical protein
MAWGYVREMPLSREQYDHLDRLLTKDPDGLILHAAAPKGDGMLILDVWDSKEANERFEREVLFPAFEQAGVKLAGGPPPRNEFDVHKLRGRAAAS